MRRCISSAPREQDIGYQANEQSPFFRMTATESGRTSRVYQKMNNTASKVKYKVPAKGVSNLSKSIKKPWQGEGQSVWINRHRPKLCLIELACHPESKSAEDCHIIWYQYDKRYSTQVKFQIQQTARLPVSFRRIESLKMIEACTKRCQAAFWIATGGPRCKRTAETSTVYAAIVGLIGDIEVWLWSARLASEV